MALTDHVNEKGGRSKRLAPGEPHRLARDRRVALIDAALWLVGPTLALIALLFLGAVIVPSCIEIAKRKS
jgi:hypothetical protein